MLVAHNKQKGNAGATEGWRSRTAADLDTAKLARDMLVQNRADTSQQPVVHSRVQEAAAACDHAAASTTSDQSRVAASDVATSLRNLMFAQEAEQLLHQAAVPPSAEQLAGADSAWRARLAELDDALRVLEAEVSPPRQ